MLIRLILFKIGWFAVVVGAANDFGLAGSLFAAVIVAYHLATSDARRRDVELLTAALAIGIVWESLLVGMDLLAYPASPEWVAPYWIIAMWGLFSILLREPLGFLRRHWSLPIIAGALGGASAFFAGAGIGAVVIQAPATYAVIGAGWAVWLPLLVKLADRPTTQRDELNVETAL